MYAKGLPGPCDRFDIAEAYHMYYTHYHANGRTRRCIATGRPIWRQLRRMGFRPSPLLYDENDLTEEGRAVYDALVEYYEE